MKKILLVLGICGIVNLAGAQQGTQPSFENAKHELVASVKAGGFYDKNNTLVFQINANGALTDANKNIIGYFAFAPEFQDKDHKTIGYMKGDKNTGIVENAQHEAIGYVLYDGSGTIQDSKRNTIGYMVNTEPTWAAAYFFFYHK